MIARIIIVLLLASQALADEVWVVVGEHGKVVKRSGTIVDIRGENLTLKLASRNVQIPLSRIESYSASWSDTQIAADAKYEAREFDTALDLYRKAYRDEKRNWAKRRILDRVVWCYRNTGQVAEACRIFGNSVGKETDSPYFDAIPLLWELKQCPADVKKVVGGWVGKDATPTQRLLAASWLFVQNRRESIATLRELGRNESKQISSLAVAQLWRAELLTMDESRLDWRKEQLLATPRTLRAGQYFLLGQTYARFNSSDDAVLAFTRVPLMFPDDVVLGQKSLRMAAELLLAEDTSQEAIVLLQKSEKLAANSREGKLATEKLKELMR